MLQQLSRLLLVVTDYCHFLQICDPEIRRLLDQAKVCSGEYSGIKIPPEISLIFLKPFAIPCWRHHQHATSQLFYTSQHKAVSVPSEQ